MSTLAVDAITVQIAGQTPWPDNVRLFQQYEVGQILMPDFASCLSVKTFLNMCGLKFQTELRTNAEFMSPSGKTPLLQVEPLIISELESVVTVAQAKGHTLTDELSDEQKTEMKAFMSLVRNVFVNAQLYILWYDKETREKVTKPRYGSPYKWPLNKLLPWQKQNEVVQMLQSTGWTKKSLDQVYDEVNTCCQALNEKLGNKEYFFGTRPTELDALVFGHLFTALTTALLSDRLADTVRKYSKLSDFCCRVHQKYFSDLQKDVQEST